MEWTTNFITTNCWRCRPLLTYINFLAVVHVHTFLKKKKKAMVVNKSCSLSKTEVVIEQQLSLEL